MKSSQSLNLAIRFPCVDHRHIYCFSVFMVYSVHSLHYGTGYIEQLCLSNWQLLTSDRSRSAWHIATGDFHQFLSIVAGVKKILENWRIPSQWFYPVFVCIWASKRLLCVKHKETCHYINKQYSFPITRDFRWSLSGPSHYFSKKSRQVSPTPWNSDQICQSVVTNC